MPDQYALHSGDKLEMALSAGADDRGADFSHWKDHASVRQMELEISCVCICVTRSQTEIRFVRIMKTDGNNRQKQQAAAEAGQLLEI